MFFKQNPLKRPQSGSHDMRVPFLRLGETEHKETALFEAISAVRSGRRSDYVFEVDTSRFEDLPGSQFCYWVSDEFVSIFRRLPAYERDGRVVHHGLSTKDDFRFVRAWWEVHPLNVLAASRAPGGHDDVEALVLWCKEQVRGSSKWVFFAKAGDFSPYYTTYDLVVNWKNEGEEIEEYVLNRYPYLNGNAEWILHRSSNYFWPGVTWPRRAHTFAPVVLPAGMLFSGRSYSTFCHSRDDLPTILAILSSNTFDYIFKMVLGRIDYPEFLGGKLRDLPYPSVPKDADRRLETLSLHCTNVKREMDQHNETSPLFLRPALLEEEGTLRKRANQLLEIQQIARDKLVELTRELNAACAELFSVTEEDWESICAAYSGGQSYPIANDQFVGFSTPPDPSQVDRARHIRKISQGLLSYCVGCILGRWDVRHATAKREPSPIPDPYTPLPVCSPGMLTGDDGLPLPLTPSEYPLSIAEDGIVVDDKGHRGDIAANVRAVLELVFSDKAGAMEAELVEALGVRSLREFFRGPFFKDQVGLYSAGARNAPIYWPLSAIGGQYTIWLYAPRYTKDTLHYVDEEYLKPKLRMENDRANDLRSKTKSAARPDRRRLEDDLQRQEDLLANLRQLEQDLLEAANLNLDPDHDDGAILNLAPLHKMISVSGIPWKGGKGPVHYWGELLKGKYPWSTISKQLSEANLVAQD